MKKEKEKPKIIIKYQALLLLCFVSFCFSQKMPLHAQDRVKDTVIPSYEAAAEMLDWQETQEGRRIVVENASVEEDYGANQVYHIKPSGETILEYDNQAQAKSALTKLSREYDCYQDRLITVRKCDQKVTVSDTSTGISKSLVSSPVTVAVLDEGFALEHPDFQGRILDYVDFIGEESTESAAAASKSHGTHVAGLLARTAPGNVDLYLARVIKENRTSTLTILNALRSSLEHGADVINISLEWSDKKTGDLVEEFIREAYAKGVLVVASAGNDGEEISHMYPQCIDEVVTVGALDCMDSQLVKADFSNYGKQIDFVAPGVNVESSDANSKGSITMSGTSMSSPQIAADLAYLMGRKPGLSSSSYLSQLRQLCLDLGQEGKDADYGWGYPDLKKCTDSEEKDSQTGHIHTYIADQDSYQAPSCKQDGQMIYRCSQKDCGQIYQKRMPKTGHIWESPVKESEITVKCARCGQENTKPEDASESMGNVSWKITKDLYGNYTLTLSGEGNIPANDQNDYPWKVYGRKIQNLVIKEGITSIPDFVFSNMTGLEDAAIPASVTSIGDGAFAGCQKLKTFQLGTGSSFMAVKSQADLQSDSDETYMALCDKTLQILYYCNPNSEFYPDSINTFQPYSLAGNKMLRQFTVKENMTIRQYALINCHHLAEIYFADQQTARVEAHAFEHVVADLYYEGQTPDQSCGDNLILQKQATLLNADQTSILCGDTIFSEKNTEWMTPDLQVSYRGQMLRRDEDYAAYYFNNQTPGRAYVKIIGKGKYCGSLQQSFQIQTRRFRAYDLQQELNQAEDPYALIEKYENYQLYIRNEDGSKVESCESQKLKATIYRSNPYYTCTGSVMVAELKVDFHHIIENVPYQAAVCTENGHEAHYRCKVCGSALDENGNWLAKNTDQYAIKKIGHYWKNEKIDKASVSKAGRYHQYCNRCGIKRLGAVIPQLRPFKLVRYNLGYTGKVVKPEPLIKDVNFKMISSNYYSFTAPDSIKLGTYQCKITMKGIYTGSATITYKIVLKSSKIMSLTASQGGFKVTWQKITPGINQVGKGGYQIQYSTDATFKNSKLIKTDTIRDYRKLSKSYSKLSRKKRYYVRVRTTNGSAYSAWSEVANVVTK